MSSASAERVLVVPTAVLHRAGLFQGLHPDAPFYLSRLLDPAHLSFRPRQDVETDPSFKQIIPYVVLRWRDQLYHYTRGVKAGEARLRALRSVGVGGHINAADAEGRGDPYRAGLLREVEEEIYLETAYRESCLGLINDDSTPVGQVHLGVVHLFDLDQPRARRREEGLTDDGFAPAAELHARSAEFETWSRFVLAALAQRPGTGDNDGSPGRP